MKLLPSRDTNPQPRIMALSFLFGGLYWLLDGCFDYFFYDKTIRFMLFESPLTLLDSLVFRIPPHDYVTRLTFMGACLVGGYLMSRLVKALSASERKYRRFIDSSPDAIVVLQDGGYKMVNTAFTTIFGYTEEDVKAGLGYEELVKPEDRDFVRKRVKDRMAGKEVGRHVEIELVAKDGTIVPCETSGQLIQYNKEDADLVVMRDITERRKVEEELQQLNAEKRQQSKMEAIGNFANGIAHDFNNALTPVIGGCEVMLYNLPNECTHVCGPQLKSILAAATTASTLVHRLQTFTRSEDEQQGPLKLTNCLKESFEFLRSMTPSTIEMYMQVAPDVHLIMANDVTVHQILMNLCKNAIQAIPFEEGFIKIDVRNEKIMVSRFGLEKGDYVGMTVEDNGKGMTPEVMEKALDPYFTTKAKGIGTGIGLSIVNSIVKGYGGVVRLYSEESRGTKVVIYLPAIKEEEGMEVRECQINEIPEGNGERILVVDDEKYVLEVVVNLLKSLNYNVIAHMSSTAALTDFLARPDFFDAVVTDLTMPGLSGVVLITEMRKIRPELKVILCSGLGSNGKNTSEIFGEKVDGYLTKPCTRATYGNMLYKVLYESDNGSEQEK